MANNNWNTPGSGGEWSNSSNWTDDSLPTSADDVILGGSTTPYAVDIGTEGPPPSSSCACGEPDDRQGRDSRSVGRFDPGSSRAKSTFREGGGLAGNGNVIANNIEGAGTITAEGGTLDITVANGIDQSTATKFDFIRFNSGNQRARRRRRDFPYCDL